MTYNNKYHHTLDVFAGTIPTPVGNYGYTSRYSEFPNPTQFDWLNGGVQKGNLTAPLPVTLISFKAKAQNRIHEISWATATEVHNRYFVVERSGEDLQWEDLQVVTGAGNSDQTRWYRCQDANPLDGINYYRLRQVDFDGRMTYSYTIEVSTEHAVVRNIYPNPVRDYLFIQLSEEAQVVISDALGREVYNQVIDGSQPIRFADLNSGLYMLSVLGTNGVLLHTQKIVKY